MKKKLLILCMLALMLCPFISSFTVKAKEDAPTYTVLVLDASGKHEFYTKKYGEYKLIYTADSACDEMKAASSEFASKLLGVDENQYIAVVVCGNTAERLSGFTNDKNAIVKKIKNIRTASEAEDCDLNAGLEDAHALLSAVTDANAKKNVVVFTTGYANTGEYWYLGRYNSETPGSSWYNMDTGKHFYAYANKAYESATVLHKYANVYTVGLFDEWEGMPDRGKDLVEFFKLFTKDLANPLENYRPVNGAGAIDETFAEICNDIVGNPYDDVTYKEYYFNAVLWADEEGITTGTDINSFDPSVICTREQMVTFLWRKAGKPMSEAACPFKDVNPKGYSYDAIRWAVDKGITNGTSKTTFSPTDIVTREQVVTFLWRVAGCPKADVKNVFKDVAAGTYSYEAILWAQKTGITTGTTPTTFDPADPCTRGQIITFLYRYYVENGGTNVFDKEESKKEEAEDNKEPESSTPEDNKPIETPDDNEDLEKEPEHTHVWVDVTQTIEHPAETKEEVVVIKEAWTETVPVYGGKLKACCSACGEVITNLEVHRRWALMLQNWECTDADVEYKYTEIVDTKIIEHPAETETKTVVVKEAWTETVVIGQKCSGCDAEK